MSEYPEYDELQALRAKDRRHRTHAREKHRAEMAYQRSLIDLALGMHYAEDIARDLRAAATDDRYRPLLRSPRWYRRSLTRSAARHDAVARIYRRALVEANRTYRRPVIKKGLSR